MKLSEVVLTELEKTLSRYNIQNYVIREDGLVDVKGDVNLSNSEFRTFPIKFGKVDGYFNCSGCTRLTSLEGAPEKVGGAFICMGTRLTSLKGAPQEVGGNFDCSFCHKLTSLKGAPQEVTGHFDCFSCSNLISLEGAPQKVSGNFDCSSCRKLTSLESALEKVGGYFNCLSCPNLTSLEGAPQEVTGHFDCTSCSELTSLKGAPEKVGGNFYCSRCTKLTSLDYLPKQMNRILNICDLPIVKNYLIIFKTKGITEIEHDNKQLEKIINKYLPKRDMLNCQDELIEAGLEQYAEIE